ncbi:MAG: YraN family protein [Hyphomonadaceae bacterium]|nr:YraN family protein [Hyphomonadaceae bacterium]
MPPPSRQRLADRLGRRAEWLAALWLMAKGYTILERRVRHPAGEIDLIALRGRVLAFVEVKARRTLEDAKLAVTPAQQAGIVRAASSWCGRRPWTATREWRFDLVAIGTGWRPRHLCDAWRTSEDPALAHGKPMR